LRGSDKRDDAVAKAFRSVTTRFESTRPSQGAQF